MSKKRFPIFIVRAGTGSTFLTCNLTGLKKSSRELNALSAQTPVN
jgi:hypothetical protein